MAIIAPFRGLTYNFHALKDVSKLVAPPYDVISEEEQEGYYQAHPYNVIRLILGKKKTGDTDWDNRYTRSADDFKRWQSEEVLVQSKEPAMFVTSLCYDPEDGSGQRTRWGLISLVRIEDEGSEMILPHERTFSAHKDDRFRLMRACNAQFSQIFALYEDPENQAFIPLRGAIQPPPLISFDFRDGTRHSMWAITDRTLHKRVADTLNSKRIFIADGHHRYETSRNYRNMMRARYGLRPSERAYEYVMMYLSNMDHDGLTILPSHRVIKRCPGFELDSFLKKVGEWFQVTALSFSGPDLPSLCSRLKQSLEEAGRHTSAIGLVVRDRFFLLSLKPGVRDEMGDDLHTSLKELDVMVLSRFIFQKGLGFRKEDLDDEEIIYYQSDMTRAVSMVKAGRCQMAFLLNPTRMDHVKDVAGNALIMPRKSTYFYPKILSGLVFNKIDPNEIIKIP